MSDYKIDSHKAIFHPSRIASLLESGDEWEKAKTIYPIYMELSPFGGCNHRCAFCAMDFIGYQAQSLDFEIMRERIPELASLGVKSIMFAGEGEPLLYRKINELTNLACDCGINTAFTTNGVKLDGTFVDDTMRRVSWIKVSFNGGTASTYGQIHGTDSQDFYKVLTNVKNAVDKRNDHKWPVTIGLQSLLLPENYEEMETLASICADEIGVDYLVLKPYSQHHSSETRTYETIDYKGINRVFEKANVQHRRIRFRLSAEARP